MKKRPFKIFAALFIIVCLIGCSNSSNDASNETPSPDPDALSMADIRSVAPQVVEDSFNDFINDNNDFCFDLYTAVKDADDAGNIFISPFSLSCALAMTWAGARNNTEAQMADALHFSYPQAELHALFSALTTGLNSKGADTENAFRLYVGNAMWGQTGFPFKQDFIDIVSENYGSGLTLLDFVSDPETSRTTINDWVEENTEDLIKDLLPPDSINSSTRLVLTNTIYFLADWLIPFASEGTTPKPFYLNTGGTDQIDTMTQQAGFSYGSGSGYQAVELLYKDQNMSMVVIMPDENEWETFESTLDREKINAIIDTMTTQRIRLSMPKFSFTYEPAGLIGTFKNLGMIDAFNENADFSGIAENYELAITDIFQKAFVKVDEKGTEAAAASAVVIGETATPPAEIHMNINRPFLFFILDKETGSILFIGRMMDPGEL